MNCPNCQRPNPATNAFCHACGTPMGGHLASPPVEEAAACVRCGAPNSPGMHFCKNCGTPARSDPRPMLSATPGPSFGSAPPAAAAQAGPHPVAHSCARCGGVGDPSARFCKFCGSPYDAGVVIPPVPVASTYPKGNGALNAQVVVILRDGSEGGVYELGVERTDIGSREGDIVLRDDPYLSPRHARITRRGDTFLLKDLGSVNGIYMRMREPAILTHGDMILVGQQVLRFEATTEAERHMGPATQHGVMVFGTPEQPRPARLLQYTTEGLVRDVYHLSREETVLGREQADLVFADDPFMSRRHASVTLARDQALGGVMGRCTLRDLGSSNGTSLRCHGERVLQHGDQFRLGRHLFRFDLAVSGRGGRNT